jgi:hypothetical protein
MKWCRLIQKTPPVEYRGHEEFQVFSQPVTWSVAHWELLEFWAQKDQTRLKEEGMVLLLFNTVGPDMCTQNVSSLTPLGIQLSCILNTKGSELEGQGYLRPDLMLLRRKSAMTW